MTTQHVQFLDVPASTRRKAWGNRAKVEKKDERSRSQSPDKRRLRRKKRVTFDEWSKNMIQDNGEYCSKYMRCILVGDTAVGKSCLAYRYTRESFPIRYVATVCDNFRVKLKNGRDSLEMDIWDTGSQPDTKKLRILSYPNTDLVLICFSLVDRETFEHVERVWVPEIREHLPGIPYVLVGTKLDLRKPMEERPAPNVVYVKPPTARSLSLSAGVSGTINAMPALEPRDLPLLEKQPSKKKKFKFRKKKRHNFRSKTLPSPLKFKQHRPEMYSSSPPKGPSPSNSPPGPTGSSPPSSCSVSSSGSSTSGSRGSLSSRGSVSSRYSPSSPSSRSLPETKTAKIDAESTSFKFTKVPNHRVKNRRRRAVSEADMCDINLSPALVVPVSTDTARGSPMTSPVLIPTKQPLPQRRPQFSKVSSERSFLHRRGFSQPPSLDLGVSLSTEDCPDPPKSTPRRRQRRPAVLGFTQNSAQACPSFTFKLCEFPDKEIRWSEAMNLSKKVGAVGYHEVSALKSVNVDKMFQAGITAVIDEWLRTDKNKRKDGCIVQ